MLSNLKNPDAEQRRWMLRRLIALCAPSDAEHLTTASGLARKLDLDSRTMQRRLRNVTPRAYLSIGSKEIPLYPT